MPKKVAIRDEREDHTIRKRRLAQEAVQKFENLKAELVTEEKAFKEEHPEAWQQLEDMKRLKDDVTQAIMDAKPLIADLGESLGDFKVTLKSTKPHYDEVKFAQVMSELDSTNLGDVYKVLFGAGVISTIGLDKEAISVFFPRNPEVQEGFQDAFDPGGQALTPAVTVPKV